MYNFIWDDVARKAVESNPEKAWTLGLKFVTTVPHKLNVLEFWVSGPYAKAMEEAPVPKVTDHITVECLRQFLDKICKVTTPLGMLRTVWRNNPHFRGTYSYTGVEATKKHVGPAILEEPIGTSLLFAGEATNTERYSTVDGAIKSGWKAADRLIAYKL